MAIREVIASAHADTVLAWDKVNHVDINFTPSASLQHIMKIVGIILAIIWVLFVVAQFALPKRRGGGANKVEGVKILLAALVIMLLLNFQMFPSILTTVVNGAIDLWNAGQSLTG